MKITKRQLRRIIKEEMYRGSLINLGSSNGHRTFRGDPRLFERSYVTGILGIPLSLQESYPYSATIERQVIREQILYENWWGDDWYLFEGAYGELLKTHSAGVLLDKLHEGPILDWGKGLLSTAAQKGKEAVDKGLEAGKEALMSAKEGIKKFGKAGWNILSAMWLTMKGGASEIGSWVKSVVRMSISGLVEGIKKALKFLATKLPEWKMPTFGAAAQKGLDFITKLQDKLQTLEGWEGVVAVSGIAIGLHWLWDKVGEWVDELKEKVGGKFTDTFEGATGTEGGIEAIKKWIKDTAKEKLTAFGGDALKKVMETLASAATGVKPWWDAAVKVGKGTKLAIDALGDAAARFMRVKGPEKVTIENVTRGNTMRISKRQLIRIIREEKAKSTKKYDDDSALKGGQSELPDPVQKGIIDKTTEEREEEEKKDETLRIRYNHLRKIIREAVLSEVEFYDETPEGQLVGTEVEDANFRNALQAEKDMKAAGLSKDEIAQMWGFIKETTDSFGFMDTPMYEKLFEWFAFDGPVRMPYGTAKARDDMPDEWILDYLQDPSAFHPEAEVWAAK